MRKLFSRSQTFWILLLVLLVVLIGVMFFALALNFTTKTNLTVIGGL